MASRDKNKPVQTKVNKATQMKAESSGPTKVKFNPPVPINKWNTTALKNTLDDTIKKIMKEEYDCVENNRLMDQRLAICTIACSFSGFAMAYDYLYPFPASRMVLATCAISYFLMMGVLTLFTMYCEDNIFYTGLVKDQAGVDPDSVWTFRSILPRFSDIYTLKVTYRENQTSEGKTNEMKKSVASWFDKEGKIVAEKLFADVKELCLNVDDPKKDK